MNRGSALRLRSGLTVGLKIRLGPHAFGRRVSERTTRTFYIGSVEVVTDYNSAEQMQGRFYRRDLGVATQVITDLGNQRIRYVHRDRLGSSDVLTDEQGNVTQRLSFDAFGRRRKPDDWRLDSPYFFFGINRDTETLTQRGFTGHEQFDEHGMIHMNGRTYDPQAGRFMQADPFIPNPGLGQSYNRYSYVNNNPLTLIDPSGFQIRGRLRFYLRSEIASFGTIFPRNLAI